jgi:hypothetical protein
MITHTTKYIENLTESVYENISKDINTNTVEHVVSEDLGFHLVNRKSASFQEFYFQTLTNEIFYFATANFFQKFKKQYALQGIDNGFLNDLEKRKSEIIQNILEDKLTELYFGSFNKVKIKHKDTAKEKDLCSFFSKLVHTFRPNDYCALDNPIKIYLGLGKEGFLLSFLIISNTYRIWADKNIQVINALRSGFQQIDTGNEIRHEKITDLKLLDLIFWTKADRLKKMRKKILLLS